MFLFFWSSLNIHWHFLSWIQFLLSQIYFYCNYLHLRDIINTEMFFYFPDKNAGGIAAILWTECKTDSLQVTAAPSGVNICVVSMFINVLCTLCQVSQIKKKQFNKKSRGYFNIGKFP